ncbi:MAG TPA: cysteine desulfurase family protein [Polyangiaceae bacterium]|nr:cysteine desulfurase family protein [Polyangiaceae bacterium]
MSYAPGRDGGRDVYLDWNATTPPLPAALEAMRDVAATAWANPSSVHRSGREARAVVERAREAVAALMGVDPRDVVFTSGATEANNLALRHAPALVTSRLEHPSVVRVAEALEAAGTPVRWVPVPGSGALEPDAVLAAAEGLPPGFVVALMAANHETGVLQPVAAVADAVHERGGRLHVDAVQVAGKVDPTLWQAGDTASVAAHKLRGPKGIGALALRTPGLPRPVLLGGAQERGLRPGTVDAVAVTGFAAAALHMMRGGPGRYAALALLRDRLEDAVRGEAEPNGAEPRLPHVANLSFAGWRGDELVAALDLEGIRVASGSACSAGTVERSPVIEAMLGRPRAEAAIRVSLGETNTSSEIDDAISVLNRVTRIKS